LKPLAAILFFAFLLAPRSRAVTGIHGMKRSEFLPPYTDEGKTTFADARGQSGVYLIKNSAKEIIYVGYSRNNLYRTLYRHFQTWNDREQPRITYSKTGGYTVRVILTTPQQAERLEKYLVKRYQPRDNKTVYDNVEDGTGANEFEKQKEAEEYEPAPF